MCTEVDSGFWDGGREIVALNAEEATRVEEEGRMSLVQSTVSRCVFRVTLLSVTSRLVCDTKEAF